MLAIENLDKVLQVINDSQINFENEVGLSVSFQDDSLPYQDISNGEQVDGDDLIDYLDIEVSLPLHSADFEVRVFCDDIIETYSELIIGWAFHSLTLTVKDDTNLEDVENFLNDVKSMNECPDYSMIDGYDAAYQEVYEESLHSWGLTDFCDNLSTYIKTLYPLADIYLDDQEDSEWLMELFQITCNEQYVEDNYMVFNHEFTPHEDVILETLTIELGINFVGEYPEIDDNSILKLGDKDLYQIMPLSGFTMTQVVNTMWLQQNTKWAETQMIFISGYGYYTRIVNNYKLITALDNGEILSPDTLKKLVKKLTSSNDTWWANWQGTIRALVNIAGLKEFSNHYRHGDKYDLVARDLFNRLVKINPELCTLGCNWWTLSIDTSLDTSLDKKVREFDRMSRPLNEYIVTFDFAKALKTQIDSFPGFLDNLKQYVAREFERLSDK